MKIKDYMTKPTNLNWIIVSLESSGKHAAVGFNSDRESIRAMKMVNLASDRTLFNVTHYGYADEKKLAKYKIIRNPTVNSLLIKKLIELLK